MQRFRIKNCTLLKIINKNLNYIYHYSCKYLKSNKKGNVILEATIFLPVFIIAVMSVAFYINIISVQTQITHHIIDESLSLMPRAYKEKVAPEYPYLIQRRALNALNDKIQAFSINNYKYLYNYGDISLSVSYKIKNPLAVDLIGPIKIKNRVCFRGFIGDNKKYNPMSYMELEKEGNNYQVYVFPKYGERFHNEKCRCIVSYPKETLLTKNIINKYQECKLCKPGNLTKGSKIFLSISSGIYHQGKCSCVDKLYIKIHKSDAINQGYAPCGICGGLK